MVHHGNQEIEQDNDVNEGETAEHDETPKPCKLFDTTQLKVVQVYKSKCCPKQCLACFPQTMNYKENEKNLQMLKCF